MTTQQIEEWAEHNARIKAAAERASAAWQDKLRESILRGIDRLEKGEDDVVVINLIALVPSALCKPLANKIVKELKEHKYHAEAQYGQDQRDGEWCSVKIRLTEMHPLVSSFKIFE